jgi:hypothetical protein
MKRFLGFLLLLACARAVCGETYFLIERIEVRGLVHASADVIRTESRLQGGDEYSESELRSASDRVRRLPFVLDVNFSLERGSARDAYVLAITVSETRPFFFRSELVPFAEGERRFSAIDANILLGVRWFSGTRGVFHLAAIAHQSDRPFESSYLSTQAGYTRYGLLDDRAFLTLTVDRFSPRQTAGKGHIVPGGVLGVWLTQNQTLTISYRGIDSGKGDSRTERILEPRLAYNTTNDPEFPSHGSLLSIAPIVAWIDYEDVNRKAVHDFDVALDGHAARYWTVADGLDAAAILDGGLFHVEERGTPHRLSNPGYGSAAVQLSKIIGDDRRLELTLRAVSRQREAVPLLPNSNTQASLTWVRRNAWGILRLGVGYAW